MPKSPTSQGEQEHQHAFELYFSLGERRTYRQVASQLGISERTVRHWAKQEQWRQHLEEREAQQISDRSMPASLDNRDRDLKIVRMAKMKLTKDIAEGKVKGRVPDLEMLIRLEGELLGGDGDPLLAIINQLPDDVREKVRECIIATIKARIHPLVVAEPSTHGEAHDPAANTAG